MSIKKIATINCRGDFGNPSGTGVTSLQTPFDAEDDEAAYTALAAFFAALKTAQLTACNQGDLTASWTSALFPAKPGTGVNVDRILLVTWRLKTDVGIHRLTIPGVPETSTGVSDLSEGERLNDTGKAALAAAIEAVGGYTAGDVVVLQGKVFVKK
jgi:hypothetical protein